MGEPSKGQCFVCGLFVPQATWYCVYSTSQHRSEPYNRFVRRHHCKVQKPDGSASAHSHAGGRHLPNDTEDPAHKKRTSSAPGSGAACVPLPACRSLMRAMFSATRSCSKVCRQTSSMKAAACRIHPTGHQGHLHCGVDRTQQQHHAKCPCSLSSVTVLSPSSCRFFSPLHFTSFDVTCVVCRRSWAAATSACRLTSCFLSTPTGALSRTWLVKASSTCRAGGGSYRTV